MVSRKLCRETSGMANVRESTSATLLTVAEVAARLRISRQMVYRAIEGGRLRAYRIGGAYGPLRIPSRSVLEFARPATEVRAARPDHEEEQ